MTLILSGDITLRRTWQPMDPDAAAYITAVETADGQALEEPVKIAIDNFVLGCKADGIWNAIKASCILAGARTLNGALVPLAGTAPTNFNFVSGDYNRKTGLVGDGSTKYLDSNRNNNADPQDDKHLSVYVTDRGTFDSGARYIAAGDSSRNDSLINNFSATSVILNVNSNGFRTVTTGPSDTGFFGVKRNNSTQIQARALQASSNFGQFSGTPRSINYGVFTSFTGGPRSNGRLAFYSIGESLDLALLDARVTDLINKFAEVIP